MATFVDPEYTTTEIIKQDLARGGLTKIENRFLAGLASFIKQKKAVIVRHKNTVFVGTRPAKGVLTVHMYTLDNLTTMAEAMKVALDAVKKIDIKTLKSETENPKIIRLLKSLGMPLDVKKKGKTYAWTMDITK
jgi:hypothetical protein